MAQFQYADGYFPVPAALPVKNTGLVAITEGTGLLLDSTNTISNTASVGVLAPTASGGVVGSMGVADSAIAVGGQGAAIVMGFKWMTASGTVTAGETVMLDDTTAKLGWVKTITGSGAEVFGKAYSTATNGNQVLIFVNPIGENA